MNDAGRGPLVLCLSPTQPSAIADDGLARRQPNMKYVREFRSTTPFNFSNGPTLLLSSTPLCVSVDTGLAYLPVGSMRSCCEALTTRVPARSTTALAHERSWHQGANKRSLNSPSMRVVWDAGHSQLRRFTTILSEGEKVTTKLLDLIFCN